MAAAVVANAVDDANDCPVVGAWMKLEGLVSRAATTGKMAVCATKELDRATVGDNYELLIPVLVNYGALQLRCDRFNVN